MDVFNPGKNKDIDDNPNWEEPPEGGGEHSVKQFMNIKVKSSKEEVKVHAKNELVSTEILR